VTFDGFFSDWLAIREMEVKPSTYKNLVSINKTMLSPTFGTKKLNPITRRSVDNWWAKHSTHPVQRRNSYYALRGALEQAVDWGMLSASPCKVKDPGRDVSKKRPTWGVEDSDAVLAHVAPFYRPAIEVMFAGHLRLGELIPLDWSDVSRDGMLTVTKQRLGLGITADTKTGQHKRIRLLQRRADALQALPRGFGATPVFPASVGHTCHAGHCKTPGTMPSSLPGWRTSTRTTSGISVSASWPRMAPQSELFRSAPDMPRLRVPGATSTPTSACTSTPWRRWTLWCPNFSKARSGRRRERLVPRAGRGMAHGVRAPRMPVPIRAQPKTPRRASVSGAAGVTASRSARPAPPSCALSRARR